MRPTRHFWKILLVVLLLAALIVAPTLIRATFDLAQADQLAGTQPAQAAALYASVAQRLPWRADLYEQAGRLMLQNGESAQALTYFVQGQGFLSVQGRMALGDAYWQQGQQQQALQTWQALENEGQATGELFQRLGMAYHAQDEFDAEKQVVTRWLVIEPDNADAHFRLALLVMATQPDQAAAALDFAVAHNPSLLPYSRGLRTALTDPTPTKVGQALAGIDEWGLARAAFEQAVRQQPDDGLAWAWLGESRQHSGQGDAQQAITQGLSLSPDSAQVHAMAGLYWQRQGDFKQALAHYQAAAKLDPKNSVWQMALGDLNTRLGNLTSALAAYSTATELAPDDPQTWRTLALFCVENEVYVQDVGLGAALHAYSLAPSDSQNLDVLGRALTELQQWDAAKTMLQRAMDAAPQDSAPPFHLGLLYLQTGDMLSARQYLNQALKLDPNGSVGQQAAKLLQRYFP